MNKTSKCNKFQGPITVKVICHWLHPDMHYNRDFHSIRKSNLLTDIGSDGGTTEASYKSKFHMHANITPVCKHII